MIRQGMGAVLVYGSSMLYAYRVTIANLAAKHRLPTATVAREWMEKHILDFKRGYELANLDMSTPVDMPG